MSGYGFNIGGLVGRGPLLRFSPGQNPPRNISSDRATLYFPSDYSHIDHHISFLVKKFTRVTRTSTLSSDSPLFGNRSINAASPIAHITLPMPAQLSVGYGIDYADADLTALGELVAHAASIATPNQAGEIAENIRSAVSTAGSRTTGQNVAGMMQGMQQAIQRALTTIQGASSQQGGFVAGVGTAAAAATISRTLPNQLNAVLANLTGVVANPHKVILFTGVKHRTHTFTFNLSPRNKKEGDVMMAIIFELKRAMHPRYGLGEKLPQFASQISTGLGAPGFGAGAAEGLNTFGAASRAFFEYPNVFDIQFAQGDRNLQQSGNPVNGVSQHFVGASGGTKRLFSIGECVMESMTVDYQPLNFPAYVASIKDPFAPLIPSQIVISMAFKETDIVTKDQIEQYNR
jgi:hypothetical protein